VPGIVGFSVVADPYGMGFIIAKRLSQTRRRNCRGQARHHRLDELYARVGKATSPFYKKCSAEQGKGMIGGMLSPC
jgi:hypothetical protein